MNQAAGGKLLAQPAPPARQPHFGSNRQFFGLGFRWGQEHPAAFREFGWRFTNIVARALLAMGQRTSYDLIKRYMSNMDPLFLDYCRQWLARVEPEWEQDVAARVARMSVPEIPHSLKGRAKEMVALFQFMREKGLSDGGVDGLISAINYDSTAVFTVWN